VPAKLARDGDVSQLRGPDGWTCALSPQNARKAASAKTPDLILGARHSTVGLRQSFTPGAVPGRIYTVEPTGDITFVHVRVGEAAVVVSVAPDIHLRMDDPVWLEFDQAKLHLFDATTGVAL